MNSILNTVKKSIGLDPTYTQFDTDIIMHINMSIGILYELGIGPADFIVTDETQEWSNITDDPHTSRLVASYISMKSGMSFDPSLQSSVQEAKKQRIDELEFRLTMIAERSVT